MTISIENFIPSRTNYLSPFYDLSFDIVGDEAVNLSSLDVSFTISGNVYDAIVNGLTQSGFAVDTMEITGGYNISIVSLVMRSSVAVTMDISIDGASLQRVFNTATYTGTISSSSDSFILATGVQSPSSSYTGVIVSGRSSNILFQLNDKTEPILTGRIPVPNSTQNARDTDIRFALHDSGGEGVAITSVDMYLNGTILVNDGAFMPGYTGTVNSTTIDGFPGYEIVVNNPWLFDYSSTQEVRVVARDAITDPSVVNTIDTTYEFQIISFEDSGGASSDLVLPPTGLDLDACIIFDWLGPEFGAAPDISTLNVTLRREITLECVTSIRDDIAVVGGEAAPGYTLYLESITSGNKQGYRITVCPEVPFNELEVITIIVEGQDSQGNDTSSQVSISTREETPPDIINLSPDDGDEDIAADAPITFDMHDSAGSGVDLSRLSVFIDDAEAVLNGVAQTGYTLTTQQDTIITRFGLQFDGYHISVSRAAAFTPGRAIAVEIDGYDAYGNLATEVYDFTIAPDIDPPYFAVQPINGEEGVSRDTIIYIYIRDTQGVDPSTVNITVNGAQAVVNGQGTFSYETTVTDMEVTPGVVDGYRFAIDTRFDFEFNQRINIWAEATDLFGNRSEFSSYFVTFLDTTAPTITNIAPRDGQQEVSVRPSIEFMLRDGYDVDFKRTNVSINGEGAIIDGKPWFGFNMDATRISGGTPGVAPGDGYFVSLTPKVDFPYNSSVNVGILCFDRSSGNSAYEEVSWETVSPRVPTFEMTPAANATNVDVDTNILFVIRDDGYDINMHSLNMAIDGTRIITENVIQSPDFSGIITEVDAYHHYTGVINPRFLLEPNSVHTLSIGAKENVSGNLGELSYTFTTGDAPANPKTIYIGDQDGVESVVVEDVGGSSSTTTLLDGYFVYDIYAKTLRHVNRLAVATRDHGTLIHATNYSLNTLFYSHGDETIKVALTSNNNGTLYSLNKSRERIEVFYNILYDDEGRFEPDAYYDLDGYALAGLDDGYFTDMVVTEGTSTASDGSNTIFLGTSTGVFRIETDESEPTASETRGEIITYGAGGSERDYEILESTTSFVVALDVNVRLNHLYVATRSEDSQELNSVTYIDLETNTATGSIPEDRLIHRLINDISFKDPE